VDFDIFAGFLERMLPPVEGELLAWIMTNL